MTPNIHPDHYILSNSSHLQFIHVTGLLLRVLLIVTVSLGSIMTVDTDDILGSVVLLSGKEDLKNVLGALGISSLGVDRGTGDMGSHGVTGTVLVSHRSPWVVLGGGLGEPDITTVTSELAAGESLSNILLDTDGSSSGVDEPSTLLHVGEHLLVEETLG